MLNPLKLKWIDDMLHAIRGTVMNVTLYTKPACPSCTATKRALDRLDLPYAQGPGIVAFHEVSTSARA